MKTAHALRELITAVNEFRRKDHSDISKSYASHQLERAMDEAVRVLKNDPEVCHQCFADATWHILCPSCGAVQ